MEAMILAAGLGTRLRPLTEHTPKALVEVAGVPMLERVARRLVAAGAHRLIVNVHHLGEQVEAFVAERDGFGVEVAISREEGPAPLETGGGLLAAEPLFEKDAPFLLHNVDVISDLDLEALYAAHDPDDALATLAVNDRETSRPLLFDTEGLYGKADRRPGRESREDLESRESRESREGREGREGRETVREPVGSTTEIGFAGVHVLSPRIFELIRERGRFSIMAPYLRLAGEGHRIRPWDVSDALWLEVGTPERLEEARRVVGRG